MKKKLLVLLVSLSMTVGLMPMMAYASTSEPADATAGSDTAIEETDSDAIAAIESTNDGTNITTYYNSLDGENGALAKAEAGQTIVLLKDASVNAASDKISKDVTLKVSNGTKLSISATATGMLSSEGKLIVEAGGTLNVGDNEYIGGENASLNLSEGTAEFDFAPDVDLLTLNGTAEIPANKAFYTFIYNQKGQKDPFDMTISESSKLTVKGIFKAVNGNVEGRDGSKLDVDGTLDISGGTFEIHSKAILNGNAIVNKDGTAAVYGSNTDSLKDAHFTLAESGARVLGDADLSDYITSAGNIKKLSDVSFKSTTPKTSDTFAEGWEYEAPAVVVPSKPEMYDVTVSKSENGLIRAGVSQAAKGQVVALEPEPADGYELDAVTVTDKDGNVIENTRTAENQYIFKMPAGPVTVSATFKTANNDDINCPSAKFTDRDKTAFYHAALDWAVTNNVASGTSDTTFSPNGTCTRAQMVTFLWRAAGSPMTSATTKFSDVDESAYYYNAIQWALANKITRGTGDGMFRPDMTITRAQAVQFFYNYAGNPEATATNQFSDVAADAYYANAVAWAAGSAITSGTSASTFSPDKDCSRAETVTLIYNYMGHANSVSK